MTHRRFVLKSMVLSQSLSLYPLFLFIINNLISRSNDSLCSPSLSQALWSCSVPRTKVVSGSSPGNRCLPLLWGSPAKASAVSPCFLTGVLSSVYTWFLLLTTVPLRFLVLKADPNLSSATM